MKIDTIQNLYNLLKERYLTEESNIIFGLKTYFFLRDSIILSWQKEDVIFSIEITDTNYVWDLTYYEDREDFITTYIAKTIPNDDGSGGDEDFGWIINFIDSRLKETNVEAKIVVEENSPVTSEIVENATEPVVAEQGAKVGYSTMQHKKGKTNKKK